MSMVMMVMRRLVDADDLATHVRIGIGRGQARLRSSFGSDGVLWLCVGG